MPQNGEINEKFGIYKSVCCGCEIVIPEGVHFPDCPRHIHLTTEWKSVTDDRVRHVVEVVEEKKTPAA